MNAAVSVVPVSRDYKEGLERIIGRDTAFFCVAGRRQEGGMRGLAAALRSMRAASLYLVFEDEQSLAWEAQLKALTAVVPAGKSYMTLPDLSIRPFSRLSAIPAASKVATASAASLAWALVNLADAFLLSRRPRMNVGLARDGRVVYLNTDFWFGKKIGGSVGHIAGVVNQLSKIGAGVDYFSANGFDLISENVRKHAIRPIRTLGRPTELNRSRFQRSYLRQARGKLPSGVSFVYQRLALSDYTGVAVSRALRVPLVVEYNGSEIWVARHWGKRRLAMERLAALAEDALLRHAHLVVTVSNILKDELTARGVERERIVSYPNCVDPEIFDPARYPENAVAAIREENGMEPDSLVATFMGTFGQWHGAEVFARAAGELARRYPGKMEKLKLRFMFVGDGAQGRKVREELSKAGVMDRVAMAGLVSQEKAPAYLAASDILVSPHLPNADGSRFFGSPTKLFEYMAMGKGIIASGLEQIGETLSPALRVRDLPPPSQEPSRRPELALLAEAGSVDDLVEGIIFLAENARWRERLGRNARAEALSKYTWERHVRAILDALAAALSR